MRKKLFFILALLLTAVTGAWADEWDVVYWQTLTCTGANASGQTGGAASNIGTGVAAASRSPHAQACILIMV